MLQINHLATPSRACARSSILGRVAGGQGEIEGQEGRPLAARFPLGDFSLARARSRLAVVGGSTKACRIQLGAVGTLLEAIPSGLGAVCISLGAIASGLRAIANSLATSQPRFERFPSGSEPLPSGWGRPRAGSQRLRAGCERFAAGSEPSRAGSQPPTPLLSGSERARTLREPEGSGSQPDLGVRELARDGREPARRGSNLPWKAPSRLGEAALQSN